MYLYTTDEVVASSINDSQKQQSSRENCLVVSLIL